MVATAWWLLQRGGCSMAAAAAWLLRKGGSEQSCGCDRGCDRGCGAAAAELRSCGAAAAELRSCGAAELRLRSCGAAAATARVRKSHLSSSEHVYARSACVADVDGDGHINPKEIRTVMRDVGVKLTADEIKQLIASVDADGNGMVRKHA